MKIRPIYIIITVFAAAVILLGAYLWLKPFSSQSPVSPKSLPYPSLDKQRAALVNKPAVVPIRLLDSTTIINDLKYLSSDTCEGRKAGSAGHKRAVERIVLRMREAGLDSFNKTLIQTFNVKKNGDTTIGKNIIGWIKGTQYPEKYMVISAHYDHLGKTGNTIYHGASDNATGTACILAMAKYFKQNPQPCSLIFAAFDHEESGMLGSFYFVDHLSAGLSISNIKLNLNIDMIARNDNNEIIAGGIYHTPPLIDAINKIQKKTNVKILMGHDKGRAADNWTDQSDHFPFYLKKIPYLYFGVEDHPDYHQPTDTFDKINFSDYIENCNMIVLAAKTLNP